MNELSGKYRVFYVYVALALTTLAVFGRLCTYDFIHYDDPTYVTENPHVQTGISRESLIWAFTSTHASNWHPLTWLTHMLDCRLYGLDAGWHHMTNLLLHIVNTLLLFLVLKRMTDALWQSAFVAALFALHPLHVESVAWISERKDVLSTLFWILTMAAYQRYVVRRSKMRYLFTLVLFAIGLMAKPMLVTLPFVLLLLDFWPLGRFQNKRGVFYRLVREKVPFFVLSAISSIVTFVIQRSTGAVTKLYVLKLNIRIANASVSYLKYLGKMFWPGKLAVLYPHPRYNLLTSQVIVAALLLLVISFVVIRLAPKRRYLLTGWLWYLGTLVPVIGLVQVGRQAMADRYTYMTFTGLFIMVGWGLPDLFAKWKYRKTILGALAIVVISALSVCSWFQLSHWRNGVTLFERALKVSGKNSEIYNKLGNALQLQNRPQEAISYHRSALQIQPHYAQAHYSLANALRLLRKFDEAVFHYHQAVRIKPDFTDAYVNLGITFISQKKFDEAVNCYRQALKLDPDDADVQNSLAKMLTSQGRLDEAISSYRQAIRINPDNAEAHNNLGNALQSSGKLNEAAAHFRHALRLNPQNAETHNNLGVILASQNKFNEAAAHFNQALRLWPDFAQAHYNLGNALLAQQKLNAAISHFRKALKANPNYLSSLNALAHILAAHPDPKIRNPKKAIELAQRAAGLTNYQDAAVLNTLAAAYASAGEFEKAAKTAQTALELATAAKNERLADSIRKQLELYKQSKP